MSVRAILWAWQQGGLGSTKKLVLMSLADNADHFGLAYPSIPLLCVKCDIADPRTVRRHIAALEEAGKVRRIQRQRENGSQASNWYQLEIPEKWGWGDCPTHPDGKGREMALGQSPQVGQSPQGGRGNCPPLELKDLKEQPPPVSPPKGGKRTRKQKGEVDRPTLEEVTAYAASRKSAVNPKDFFDYFENGKPPWHDSTGKPVLSWKQKFITHERFVKEKGRGPDTGSTGGEEIGPEFTAWRELGRTVNQIRRGAPFHGWNAEHLAEVVAQLGGMDKILRHETLVPLKPRFLGLYRELAG